MSERVKSDPNMMLMIMHTNVAAVATEKSEQICFANENMEMCTLHENYVSTFVGA